MVFLNISNWWWLFLIQAIYACYQVERLLFKQGVKILGNKSLEQKEWSKKYYAFQRMDLHKIKRWRIYPGVPFIWLRLALAYFFCTILAFILFLISLTQKSDQYLGWRQFIIKWACKIVARIFLFSIGVLPGLFSQEKKHVDYRKYLGPDWKPTDERPSTICCNHSSWMDVLVNTDYPPSSVTKEGTKNIPVVGYVTKVTGSIYINRDSKVRNTGTQDQINKRQKDAEKGLYPPIIFYPEGGTSNGRYLLNFKKGAFVGLNSIQPVFVKWDSPFSDAENCVMKIQVHAGLQYCSPWQKVHKTILPVFKPNEYFFKNHQKEGEEKWETYLRVIRDIMSDASGLPKSDLKIEDKFAYKELLYPQKVKGKSNSTE